MKTVSRLQVCRGMADVSTGCPGPHAGRSIKVVRHSALRGQSRVNGPFGLTCPGDQLNRRGPGWPPGSRWRIKAGGRRSNHPRVLTHTWTPREKRIGVMLSTPWCDGQPSGNRVVDYQIRWTLPSRWTVVNDS
jgi:hypothetical protein